MSKRTTTLTLIWLNLIVLAVANVSASYHINALRKRVRALERKRSMPSEVLDPTIGIEDRIVGSTWLVESGPEGSKVVEQFKKGEDAARKYAEKIRARGVSAEVIELVQVAIPLAFHMSMRRDAINDPVLVGARMVKALLKAADSFQDSVITFANDAEKRVDAGEKRGPRIVLARPAPGMSQ